MNTDEEALLGRQDVVFVNKSAGSSCCKCCGCCCCSFLALVLWVVFFMMTTECGTRVSPVEHILPENALAAGLTPPFESGTLGNMFLDPALDLNFTGIWWMDGNPLIWEQLVSFAGAQGMAPYPTTVYNPSSLAGHWTWSDNFFGRGIMMFYAFTSYAEETHDFFFTNKTYADIDATSDLVFGDGTFPMSKINEDEWDRVNSYVLRRIVYGDGTPHPVFWPKFLDWYKSTFPGLGIAVMSSNNDCIRRCQYVAPCFVCQPLCGVA
mmetsp:Transcript_107061/g.149306  ORF Transcript_107061/g.149306 Transcript_107061/m.149306 type:complete len:265 (+) Transcript_107061:63-857(+)|eukprot:s3923_g7.t1